MKTVRIASKMMLSGEYAVLSARGEAVAMGTAPGFVMTGEEGAADSVDLPDLKPAERSGARRFVEASLRQVQAWLQKSSGTKRPQLALSFRREGREAEVSGGSAALCIGATACALELAGHAATPQRLLELAGAAHCEAQGGGSGYDIATQVYGGLVHFVPQSPATSGAGGLVVAEQSRRTGFAGHLVWAHSGVPAPTATMLSRFENALQDPLFAKVLDRHAAASRNLGRLLFQSGWCPELANAVERANETLQLLDEAGSLGVFTAGIRHLIACAQKTGFPARVSGAGGGDRVVGFAPASDAASRLVDAWRGAGFVAGVVVPGTALSVIPTA
jgi:mevalonate kinase